MRTFAQKPKATLQSMVAKSLVPGRVHSGQSREVHSILHLQRTVGNQAVQRLLQSNAEELNAGWIGTASPHFGHDFSRIPVSPPTAGAIQTKLAINMPGDEYEQEADRVAEQVMRMPESKLQHSCACGGGCPKCQAEQLSPERERLQTKRVRANDTEQVSSPRIVHEVLQSPGQPLDSATRAFMESRFGHDFSPVRVHDDAKAVESARALNARAYTLSKNIYFDHGNYAPRSWEGKRLLAHELTHVVQQRTGSSSCIQRRVVDGHVSCHGYPRTYPIFRAIGTDDPVGQLQAADARALEMLNNTIAELTHIRARVTAGDPPAWPLIGDAIALGMRNRLRLDPDDSAVWTGRGPGTIEIVIRWYTNIRDLLTSGAIHYSCLGSDCDADDWAYTLDGVPRRIHLCRLFWSDSQDERALTLIHETAHLYYGLEDTGGGAGNASCLEQFMADTNGVAILPALMTACRAPAP